MRKYFFLNIRRPNLEDGFPALSRNVSRLMLFMFLLGVLVGGVVGLSSSLGGLADDPGEYVSAYILPRSLPESLWSAAVFFLLLLAFGTSWLGMFLSPAAVLLRGYLLSCSVSALFAAYAWRGLLYAALVSGVPALFLVPCFLLLACDAFFASQRLMELRFGRGAGAVRPGQARRMGAAALLVLLDGLYVFYFLPLLLEKL